MISDTNTQGGKFFAFGTQHAHTMHNVWNDKNVFALAAMLIGAARLYATLGVGVRILLMFALNHLVAMISPTKSTAFNRVPRR